MPNIEIDTFDFTEIIQQQPSINVAILGKRNTGKSTIISQILYELHKGGIKRFVVFSAQEARNCHYRRFGVPGRYCFTKWDEAKLQKIFEINGQMKEAKMRGELPPDFDLRLVVVIDDFAYDRKVFQTTFMREIYANGRHPEISLIITLQDIMAIPPLGRDSIDIVMTLRTPSSKMRRKIFEEYPTAFDDYGEFEKMLRILTNNYGAMVYKNLGGDETLKKTLFHYKGTPGLTVPNLGSREWREYRTLMPSDGFGEGLGLGGKKARNVPDFQVTIIDSKKKNKKNKKKKKSD